jgi:undecaprenyl-diphosphatase
MIDTLRALDQQAFLLLNGSHAPWLDTVMVYASMTLTWIPLYLALLFYIIKYDKDAAWVVLIGVAVTIVLSDQITSTLLKPLFSRLRPSWNPALTSLIHIVDGYRGGKFGFPSSHSANTFGTVIFLILVSRKRWMFWLLLWPALVSYSRIYLGVHYPADVLAGAIVGGMCAWLSSAMYQKYYRVKSE